jgi:nitrogen fixation protein FixH
MTDDFAFTYEKVSVAEAKEVLKGPAAEKKDFTVQRKPQDPSLIRLKEATMKWVLAFPAEMRPLALAKKYPRIANILAEAWPTPTKFEAKLNEYLLDDRPSRQGFPVDVAMDFVKLKQHFTTVDTRVKDGVWNLNIVNHK